MRFKSKLKVKAFSLVEIILALGIFSLIISSVGIFAIDSARLNQNSRVKVKAGALLQEYSNAVLLLKKVKWSEIVAQTSAGDKHLALVNNAYAFVNGKLQDSSGVEISVNVLPVYRSGGVIVPVGEGTLDLHTREIKISLSWTDFLGKVNTLSKSIYINDWETERWLQTTVTDFQSGSHNSTLVANNAGGEVELGSVIYSDWCKPSISLTSFDLPGQAYAKTIAATPGNAFTGTGGNSSGDSFSHIKVTDTSPPTTSINGTFDGYKGNQVFGESNYGYLTSDANGKEVVILNIATTPYTEVGYFDPSGNGNGEAIYVVGNVGYMSVGTQFKTFDLNSHSGSRAQLGSITLAGTISKIMVVGSYAYVTQANSSEEFVILDVSNPSSISKIGTANLDSATPGDLFVNSTGTRTYIGTANSATQSEFFIIDTTTKTGAHSALSTYDTTGMSVKGVTVIDNRAIIVGNGAEEYQVLKLDTETSPERCAGLQIDTGVNGVATITEASGNVYSYVVTNDTTAEFKVIKGGKGGGGAGGVGYPDAGDYTSVVFDSNSTSSIYYAVDWQATVPSNTTLRLQMRSGASSDLAAATWVGPDGTNASYFSTGQASIPAVLSAKRYIQFKVLFSSDTISTPVLTEVKINYGN